MVGVTIMTFLKLKNHNINLKNKFTYIFILLVYFSIFIQIITNENLDKNENVSFTNISEKELEDFSNQITKYDRKSQEVANRLYSENENLDSVFIRNNLLEEVESFQENEISASNFPISFSNLFGGSSGIENCQAIAVDNLDNIIVTGDTVSSDFPIQYAYDSTFNGFNDVFISKFSNDGSLQWSTFLGGNSIDHGNAIACDSFDNVIVTGTTYSSGFPTLNSYDNTHNGYNDIFISKFSNTGYLIWSTYLGGSANDHGQSVTVDSEDNIIITGYTDSSDFPVINSNSGELISNSDIFVTKLNSEGSLIWSTHLGGYENDYGYDITVDNNDNIIITGITYSNDFPIINGFSFFISSYVDGFIVKLNKNGILLWSTYLGGNGDDNLNAVKVDSNENIIIIGDTYSSDFPIYNSNASHNYGYQDVFITKVDKNGSLLWSTIIGGEYNDYGKSVYIDYFNNIIITGYTQSSNFPTLNAFQRSNLGYFNCFIANFSSFGVLKSSTYFGGSGNYDTSNDIAIDKNNNIIITGNTNDFSEFPSTNSDLVSSSHNQACFLTKFISLKKPIKFNSNYSIQSSNLLGGTFGNTYAKGVKIDHKKNTIIIGDTTASDIAELNSYNNVYSGFSDVFIAKYAKDSSLIWFTYLGGKSYDYSNAIAIDSKDNIVVTGYTKSTDFPTLNAYDDTKSISDSSDAFVSKFSKSGTLLWSTYLGGFSDDYSQSLVVDSEDNIIVTGYTDSTDFPILDAFEGTHNNGGYSDAFVTKFSKDGSLLWSTFLGGNNIDYGNAIACDSFDNIIVTGKTESDNFPTLNAYDNTLSNNSDAFLTKFSSDGSFLWSTYLGGNSIDYGIAIACDSFDNIIVTGKTDSADFPTLNAYDNTYNGGFGDIFIIKFSNNNSLLWSTFLGGFYGDYSTEIVINKVNEIFISGYTFSYDFSNDSSIYFNRGGVDNFLAKCHQNGESIKITTFGDSNESFCNSLAIDYDSEDIILVGYIHENNYFLGNEYSNLVSNNDNAFILRISNLEIDPTDNNFINDFILLLQDNLILLAIVILIILCYFMFIKVLNFKSVTASSNNIKSNQMNKKNRENSSIEIIEETKRLVNVDNYKIDKESSLWKIIEEFRISKSSFYLKLHKNRITNEIRKIVDNLPNKFEENEEKMFIAINKVILARNGQKYLACLNSEVNERISSGNFELKLPDSKFIVQLLSLPFFPKTKKTTNKFELKVLQKHYQLLGTLITEIAYLEHLQWEYLPIIAKLFDNYYIHGDDVIFKECIGKKIESYSSLDFKILLSENIYLGSFNNYSETISSIIMTITIRDLLNLTEVNLESIIKRIAKLNLKCYPLPLIIDDIPKLPLKDRHNLLSIMRRNKIKVSDELVSIIIE